VVLTTGADLHTNTILSGTLGVAINGSTHPQYAVHVEYLAGKGDMDQLQTSGVKPRMLIARVNGKDVQGAATTRCAKAGKQGRAKLALLNGIMIRKWLAGGLSCKQKTAACSWWWKSAKRATSAQQRKRGHG
jgi:hypothetical protein